MDGVADGQQQVGLAEPGVSVDEQRVVGLARILGHGGGGRVGEAVGVADDEVVEGIARHLGQGIVAALMGHFAQLVLGDDQDLELLGEEVVERGLDAVREALLQDILLELRRGAQDQTAVVELGGRTVGEPGVHGGLRELTGQDVQNLLPDVVNGIHA